MVDIAQRERTIFPDARENYIYETHNFNSPTNVINRELQRSNDLRKAYEVHTVPEISPNWVTRNPNASEMINNWTMPGGGSWVGSPMWMDAKNKTYGLPGTEVAQSKWKEKFRSIIDMIMNRESLNERDAKKYIFDNYGLAV